MPHSPYRPLARLEQSRWYSPTNRDRPGTRTPAHAPIPGPPVRGWGCGAPCTIGLLPALGTRLLRTYSVFGGSPLPQLLRCGTREARGSSPRRTTSAARQESNLGLPAVAGRRSTSPSSRIGPASQKPTLRVFPRCHPWPLRRASGTYASAGSNHQPPALPALCHLELGAHHRCSSPSRAPVSRVQRWIP